MESTQTLSLKAIRVNLRLTVEELAEKMNISAGRYRRLENHETQMYATELVRFHQATGAPYDTIRLHD